MGVVGGGGVERVEAKGDAHSVLRYGSDTPGDDDPAAGERNQVMLGQSGAWRGR